MENEKTNVKQPVNNNVNGSQINPVGRFGNSPIDKQEKSDIRNRLDSSRSRNLNNNNVNTSNISSGGSGLGSKSGLDESSHANDLTSKTSNDGINVNKNSKSKKTTGGIGASSNSLTSDKLSSSGNSVKKKKGLGGLLGSLGFGAAKKVGESNEAVGTAVNTVQNVGMLAKVTKVLIAFFSNPISWILIAIVVMILLIFAIPLLIAVVVNSLGMKFGLSGDETLEIFNNAYVCPDGMSDEECEEERKKYQWVENMTQEEIESLVSNADEYMCELSFIQRVRFFFGLEDLTNNCELAHYVNNLIKDKESATRVNPISPGFFMTSLYYAFDTQNRDEDGNLFIKPSDAISNNGTQDDLKIVNDLDAITTLMAAKLYDKDDLDDLLDNYVFHNYYTYWIWTYFPPTTPGGTGYWACVSHQRNNYNVDDKKFKLYLRYGQNVVNSYVYETNQDAAYSSTSTQCLSKLDFSRPTDLDKYNTMADPDTLTDDNAKITLGTGRNFAAFGSKSFESGTYGYDSGFIFKTYPKYNPKYSINGIVDYDFKVDKDIEQIIEYTESRQDYTNYILGYPNTVNTDLFSYYSSGTSTCTYNIDGVDISNIKVKLLHGASTVAGVDRFDPIEGQDLINFEDYIVGVVYGEVGGFDDEVLKTQAIAARSYALARVKAMSGLSLTEENGQWILTIRNSNEDQAYCNPDKGCSRCEGYNTIFSNDALPSGAVCEQWKPALSSDHNIRKVVRETAGMIIVDSNNKPIHASYNATIQRGWQEQAIAGKDYVEILKSQYSDSKLVSSDCTYAATGDWAQWRQWTEPWGSKLISTSTMTKVGCYMTAHAMLLAKSAPKLTISNFNPGTFLDMIKANGYNSGNNFSNPRGALQTAVGSDVKVTYAGASLSGKSYSEKVSTISSYLNQGYDIILRVKSDASASKYNESSNQHWVLVTGVNGSDIYMADPASDQTIVLNKYHNEGIIYFNYVKFE